jgi:hypothetical protein
MKDMAAVTLSNENGPSRSRPSKESHPALSGAQRAAYAPGQPDPPNAVRHLRAGRP